MYQKRVTLPDTGSLILKHFEMTDQHVQSALYENFLDLTPNICSEQIQCKKVQTSRKSGEKMVNTAIAS